MTGGVPAAVAGAFLAVVGIAAIIFHRAIARFNVWGQNQMWGTAWGDRARRLSGAWTVVGGLAFTALGAWLIIRGLSGR